MNYSELLAKLNAASAFDLYRLRAAIDRTLDEPSWVLAVQSRLHVGQTVEAEPLERPNAMGRATRRHC
ncbi:hypothetical protein MX652_14100 [Thauera aromatica]|nr:hypothetical protein [Thauera aromatica]MCK2127817.1 hypothetical protein [Thauera aromatica]